MLFSKNRQPALKVIKLLLLITKIDKPLHKMYFCFYLKKAHGLLPKA